MTGSHRTIAIVAGALALGGAAMAQAAPPWMTGGASAAPAARSTAPWAGQHLQLRLMQRDAVLQPLADAVKSTPAAIRLKARTGKTSLKALYPGQDVVALLAQGITAAKVTLPQGATATDLATRMAGQVPQARMGAGRGQGAGRGPAGGRGMGGRGAGGGTGTCRASS